MMTHWAFMVDGIIHDVTLDLNTVGHLNADFSSQANLGTYSSMPTSLIRTHGSDGISSDGSCGFKIGSTRPASQGIALATQN
jgi:hypothetical protein